MDAIHVQGLHKHFGSVRAVDGLDLSVPQGEMFGLVGPDGAGKTTTIRLLCGILAPDEGRLEVLGHPLPAERRRVHARLGYLSQRFSLYEDLSIDENIAFFADLHLVGDYRQRRDELLALTHLAPFRGRLAGRLSGGMKQKLALACTLIHRPDLLLLDEPTTGVDPVSRREFWRLLSTILASGVTILMTTPYLDEAERCHRVGLMHAGRLMTAGTPEAVKASAGQAVVELVCPEARRAAPLLRAMPGVDDLQLFGDRLHALGADAEVLAPRLRARLAEAGLEVTALRVVPPTLENAFIALLRREDAAEELEDRGSP